jgi:HK97 family phage major capsid protein
MDITLESLSGMSADELRSTIEQLKAALTDQHIDDRGTIRKLDGDEQKRFGETINMLQRAEAHLLVRNASENPRAGARAFGRTLVTTPDALSAPEAFELNADQVRDQALRLLERRGQHLSPESQDHVDELVRSRISESQPNVDGGYVARRMLITETKDYQSAFAQVLAAGQRGRAPVLTAAEAEAIRSFETFENRSMGEVTPSAGGYGVPVLIDPTIILTGQQSGDYDTILQISRVVSITTNRWKGVSSAGVSWAFQTEAATATDNSPTLAQPSIDVHMARGTIPYSIEVGEDYPNFAAEMGQLLAEGYLELASQKVTLGSGTGEPRGIVTALDANAGSEVTLTTAGTMPASEIYGLWDALPKRARRLATWMSSQSVQNKVRQLGAAAAGTADPNFTVDLTQETVQALFGKSYPVNDWMDDFVTGTGNQNLAIVGNFQQFVVVQRAGMNIEAIPHIFQQQTAGTGMALPTGKRAFFAWARIGSDSVDDSSFRLLKNKPS